MPTSTSTLVTLTQEKLLDATTAPAVATDRLHVPLRNPIQLQPQNVGGTSHSASAAGSVSVGPGRSASGGSARTMPGDLTPTAEDVSWGLRKAISAPAQATFGQYLVDRELSDGGQENRAVRDFCELDGGCR